MTRFQRLTWLVPALLLSAVGCADPLTQLILVVDTDVPLASPNPAIPVEANQLREISISLYGPCDGDGANCPVVFEDSAQQYNTVGAVAPPLSIGLVLDDPAQPGPYRTSVRASLGQDATASVINIDTLFAFAPGETRVVPIYIGAPCAGVTCGAGETCDPLGRCESEVRPTADLPTWSGELTDYSFENRDN